MAKPTRSAHWTFFATLWAGEQTGRKVLGTVYRDESHPGGAWHYGKPDAVPQSAATFEEAAQQLEAQAGVITGGHRGVHNPN